MKTKMVLCALALVIISGCETTKMSMELTGATVGAAVGGFGGAQLGSGLGMWAYSAGGVIVGGLVGYEGGRILKESDMNFYKEQLIKRCLLMVMEPRPIGKIQRRAIPEFFGPLKR